MEPIKTNKSSHVSQLGLAENSVQVVSYTVPLLLRNSPQKGVTITFTRQRRKRRERRKEKLEQRERERREKQKKGGLRGSQGRKRGEERLLTGGLGDVRGQQLGSLLLIALLCDVT